ncbi:MdtA/MuxA family multidrug efflux RND transporter periplasmic adaptor subunit [Zoogloea sp.]|uniref:MdtA/MuxA family multidrug efflux RND transporter periplasmic adaptor subunit n=1 Tax=Zoogloea sp. TaxID=49181 RepID=UPI00261326E8|nr:MdtA/MuxA family multidrug efflux RND transporter periplasmic adaptor subunit [Zoogloea sp.]MDD3352641.1 MdtA/MuxA family multidrug efflux RND transporter periplasmic adaptor subunit [Zoogloea sp.]
MKKSHIWTAVVLLSAAGAAGLWQQQSAVGKEPVVSAAKPGPGGRNRDTANRPVPVRTAASRTGEIEISVNAIGTVTAFNTVVIKPRVDGQLVRVAFREGQMVQAGALLAEIDPRPYAATLAQASGQLTRDEALLAHARLDLERYRGLLAKDSIAHQQVDAQEAQVRQLEGTVETDRAQVETARLNLSFTRVTAPLAGTLGLRQVDAGNMVRAADATGLVVLTQTQPISVLFAVPATHLPALQARAGKPLAVEAWDRDGRRRLATGRLLSTDNLIDTSTGTVRLKAQFDNPDGSLFPNQFVSTRLRLETRDAQVLVPSAAILKGAQGNFVYVVDETAQKASMRPVVLGPSTAETVSIESGLKAGEKVVIEGVDRLRDGAPVDISAPAPRPQGAGGPEGERRERKKPA